MRPLLALVLLAACGGDSSTKNDASTDGSPIDIFSYDEPGIPMTLTSPTIPEGGAIPTTHVCAQHGGQNQSPQLVFNNVPAGTQSFAVVLTDLTITYLHSAIYDVPGTLTGLPANVDKIASPTAVPGAKQTPSYQPAVVGYNGPCPPNMHTYQFKVYALGVANLQNVATIQDVVTKASASNLGTATLTGTFTP